MKTKKDPRDYSFPDQYEREKNTCKIIAYAVAGMVASTVVWQVIRLLR